VSYRAWATDIRTQQQGYVSTYNNPTQAATAAVEALFSKYPSEQSACMSQHLLFAKSIGQRAAEFG
jgi:hypothetical protein